MDSESSATTFISGNRLPWPDDEPVSMLNRAFESAAIYDTSSRHACSIRKISPLGATLRADVRKRPGDTVAIELGTGRRQSGNVVWAHAGELGVSFADPVDILGLINRSLVNQPAERRRMPRVEIRCSTYLKWSGRIEVATLRNVSAGGLQIEGEELPSKGTFVSVSLEGLIVPEGEVVWSRGNLVGIQLMQELSWTSLIAWVRDQMRKGAGSEDRDAQNAQAPGWLRSKLQSS